MTSSSTRQPWYNLHCSEINLRFYFLINNSFITSHRCYLALREWLSFHSFVSITCRCRLSRTSQHMDCLLRRWMAGPGTLPVRCSRHQQSPGVSIVLYRCQMIQCRMPLQCHLVYTDSDCSQQAKYLYIVIKDETNNINDIKNYIRNRLKMSGREIGHAKRMADRRLSVSLL